MFNGFSSLTLRYYRRWLYPFISLVTALSLIVAVPQRGQAGLFDLILQGVQIVQLSNVSNKQEVQLGKEINSQLVNREVRLNRNREINDYINAIGQRLAAKSDRADIPYTFQVVADRGINAFATMGGFVYINEGTILAADNEAQLASVIGHEIGHITGRHAIRQMRQTAVTRGVATAAGLDRNNAVKIGTELALRRPKSRKDEFDADSRGLAMLKQAGYAPSGMPSFMKKLLNGSSVPTVLSTHPNTKDRITGLNAQIDPSQANIGEGLDSESYKAKVRALLR